VDRAMVTAVQLTTVLAARTNPLKRVCAKRMPSVATRVGTVYAPSRHQTGAVQNADVLPTVRASSAAATGAVAVAEPAQ